MSDNIRRELPYQTLGSRLKRLREQQQESLAEVSGAVEIETQTLEGYEQGTNRPSKDILQLLINHFDIKEDEADKMWQLAGYESPSVSASPSEDESSTPSVLVMPMDMRVVYTDMAHVNANQYGLMINFMQSIGPNNQPLIVSRVGMSREHAQTMISLLEDALKHQPAKILPEPRQDKTKKKRSID